MSYCRWSSDFGECDVYVYEDVSGGWTTHVASRRLKHRVPDEIRNMPVFSEDGTLNCAVWVEQQNAERKWRDSLPCKEHRGEGGVIRFPKDSEYIDLSEISDLAGESFNDPTPGDCADRLEQIRAAGFNVPQYAIDALREEANASS